MGGLTAYVLPKFEQARSEICIYDLAIALYDKLGERFVSAWHRAERGQRVRESHITFLDLETMLAALSPRRLELLRHVRQHVAASTRELAAALGRDYKNVHQDVSALVLAGHLERDGRRLSAPWDEVRASVKLTASEH